jgi:hypothetical protein
MSHAAGMSRFAACAIAILIGLCGAVGVALAVVRPATAVVVAAPGCDRATAVYGLVGDQAALAVRADSCGLPGRSAYLTEMASFDVLGAAAWRTPGPSLDRIEISLDRSADRYSGRRTFVLTADQASQHWGPRPVDVADQGRTVRAVLNDVLWLCGFAVAGLSFLVVVPLVVRALRRAGGVVLWLR